MSKKTISKLIAMVCVVSLCLTAVFTGAVSATDRDATCTLSGWSYEPGAKDSYVTFEVEFTSETPFIAGSFQITGITNGLTFVDCTLPQNYAGDFEQTPYFNIDNNKVLFASFAEDSDDNFEPLTSMPLILKFTPASALDTYDAGTEWQITIDNIEITNEAEDSYDCDPVTATAHIHDYSSTVTYSGSNDEVKHTKCTLCTAKKTELAGGASLGDNSLADVVEYNLAFTKDGDTVLQALVPTSALSGYSYVYFVYTYKGDKAESITTSSTSTGTIGEYTVFPCGRNGGIGRMGRAVNGNFIAITGAGAVSTSEQCSGNVKAVAEQLMSNPDPDVQNYAKALWNYGYYTTKQLALSDGGYIPDRDSYVEAPKTLANYELPSKTAGQSGSGWSVTGISVTTGFKPKMNIKLNSSKTIVLSVYTDNTHNKLVYRKQVSVTGGTAFTISDIPVKYLTGDIELTSTGSDTKVFTYGFGRYAKQRQGTAGEADVFQSMMNYSYYLGLKYA